MRVHPLLSVPVHWGTLSDAVARIHDWAARGESRFVGAANVHTLMEAHDRPAFAAVLRAADLVVPDGMPLVWLARALGVPGAQRIRGADLMHALLARAARTGLPVGLYGSTTATLEALVSRVRRAYPALPLVYAYSPPFRPLTAAEDARVVQAMQDAGVRLLFVGLGCPKQEWWMYQHRGRVPAVMVGVGAAFDFLAGRVPQAPRWMQAAGLEWAFRLALEPRRLWRRYARHNPRFVALAGQQIWRERIRRLPPMRGT